MTISPFHLAFPVNDLDDARDFFTGILGCEEGRSAPRWVDFNFFGHQISAHLREEQGGESSTNAVDGDAVPVRHFGLILEWQQWEELAKHLQKNSAEFIIEPKTRFVGEPGEQGTMFVKGPSGNALEFKTFRNFEDIFST
ncbi:MAG: VOC family protein [Myxococcota bacterium]